MGLAPLLLGGPKVISIKWKSLGSAALVMWKVPFPLAGTWNEPAGATCPSFWLTYQHAYHCASPKLLRC